MRDYAWLLSEHEMDTPQPEDATVRQSRDLLAQQHRMWPMPLARSLKEEQRGRAMRWAIMVFTESIRGADMADTVRRLRQQWLDQLNLLVERQGPVEQCREMAIQVWDHDPELNIGERSFARLFWALENLLREHKTDYFLQLSSAIGMLDEDSAGANVPEVAFRLFTACRSAGWSSDVSS